MTKKSDHVKSQSIEGETKQDSATQLAVEQYIKGLRKIAPRQSK